jgi:RNA polymerase sigma-70 factor, ECF subfamily
MIKLATLANRYSMLQSKGWMEESDALAIAKAKAGDSDGFRSLVERHGRGVFRLAFRMTGNESDAEDIVQETFMRAYKQLNRYESRSSFSTWLYRIASNCSVDLIRSRKVRQPVEVPETLRDHAPEPDRLMYSSQVQDRVSEAMDQLSGQERTAFVLRHFEGLSIDEISGALGLNANAAKHSIFRAVQKLRKALEPVVS